MTDWFKNSSVHELTGADFDNKQGWIAKDKKCFLVLLWANWCSHCIELKPEYKKFADIAQFIKVAAIDSDAQAELLKKMQAKGSPIKIGGFPTIWIFKNGKPLKEYNGPRTAKGLLAEATKICNEKCTC